MDILNPEIQEYINSFSKHLSPELADLERETYQKVLLPHMISGAEQGRFLYQFISAINPDSVLELGTFTGYSAICMAMGMKSNSILTTLDINDDISYLPQKYFKICGLESIISYHIQPALDFIPTIQPASLDVVFIDADKKNYPLYFEILKSKIKPGGYIIIDNILWYGRVLKESDSKETTAIQNLTKMIFQDQNFVANIIPIRDGILIAKKCSA